MASVPVKKIESNLMIVDIDVKDNKVEVKTRQEEEKDRLLALQLQQEENRVEEERKKRAEARKKIREEYKKKNMTQDEKNDHLFNEFNLQRNKIFNLAIGDVEDPIDAVRGFYIVAQLFDKDEILNNYFMTPADEYEDASILLDLIETRYNRKKNTFPNLCQNLKFFICSSPKRTEEKAIKLDDPSLRIFRFVIKKFPGRFYEWNRLSSLIADKTISSLDEVEIVISKIGTIPGLFNLLLEKTELGYITSNGIFSVSTGLISNIKMMKICPEEIKDEKIPTGLKDEDLCVVCRTFSKCCVLECGHLCLCTHCPKEMFKNKKMTCPLCRAPIKNKIIKCHGLK